MVAIRTGAPTSEEGAAVHGLLMAVSGASGGMITLIEAANGSLATLVLPTVVLVGALAVRSHRLASYAATLIWVLVVPMAQGLAILAPLLMVGLCLASAVGPDRVLAWMSADWSGRTSEVGDLAWIEDDPSVR